MTPGYVLSTIVRDGIWHRPCAGWQHQADEQQISNSPPCLQLTLVFRFLIITYCQSDNPAGGRIGSFDTYHTKQESRSSQQFKYPKEQLHMSSPFDFRLRPWTHRFVIKISIGSNNVSDYSKESMRSLLTPRNTNPDVY